MGLLIQKSSRNSNQSNFVKLLKAVSYNVTTWNIFRGPNLWSLLRKLTVHNMLLYITTVRSGTANVQFTINSHLGVDK